MGFSQKRAPLSDEDGLVSVDAYLPSVEGDAERDAVALQRRRRLVRLTLASCVALLLVCAAVATAVVVNGKGGGDDRAPEGSVDPFQGVPANILAVCKGTQFQEVCISQLRQLPAVESASPADLILMAVSATARHAKQVLAVLDNVNTTAPDWATVRGLGDSNSTTAASLRGAILACKDDVRSVLVGVEDAEAALENLLHRNVMGPRNTSVRDVAYALLSYASQCRQCLSEVAVAQDAQQPGTGAVLTTFLQTASDLLSNGYFVVARLPEFSPAVKALEDAWQATHNATDGEFDNFDWDKTPFGAEDSGPSRRLFAEAMTADAEEGAPVWARRMLWNLWQKDWKPDIVVAKDGSGDFRKIQDAVDAVEERADTVTTILVKAGTYKEKVFIPKRKWVFLRGEGPSKTIITNSDSAASTGSTSKSYTLNLEGEGSVLFGLTVLNEWDYNKEASMAVAIKVNADRTAFLLVHTASVQDTLYSAGGRQYWKDCVVRGAIDYIFGDGQSVFHRVRLEFVNQGGYVTAHARTDTWEPTGYVFYRCAVITPKGDCPVQLLGRPWRPAARVFFVNSFIGRCIAPAGWDDWGRDVRTAGTWFGEKNNVGPGAGTSKRLDWVKTRVSDAEAKQFTIAKFIDANSWAPFSLN